MRPSTSVAIPSSLPDRTAFSLAGVTRLVPIAFLTVATLLVAQPPSDPFAGARAAEARVGGIVLRLSTANLSRCRRRTGALGLVVHVLDQYRPGARPDVTAATGLGAGPGVFALTPGGAAAGAGVRPDDVLLRADGLTLPLATAGAATFATAAAVQDSLDRAAADGVATLDLRARDGVERSVRIAAPPACLVRPMVTDERRGQASTDGLNLKVSRGLLADLPDDGQLAAVLAHEFAHVVLAHPAAIRARGGKGGLFGGGRGRFVRRTEEEADRLSVALLADAGFDPRAAVAFWRGWGRAHGQLFGDASHGGWDERVATLEAAIAALPSTALPAPPPAPISSGKENGGGE